MVINSLQLALWFLLMVYELIWTLVLFVGRLFANQVNPCGLLTKKKKKKKEKKKEKERKK
jgi:hypothetical protein